MAGECTGDILYPIGCPVATFKSIFQLLLQQFEGKKCTNLWSRPFCHKEYLSHWTAWHGVEWHGIPMPLSHFYWTTIQNMVSLINIICPMRMDVFISFCSTGLHIENACTRWAYSVYSNLISLNWLFFHHQMKNKHFLGLKLKCPPHVSFLSSPRMNLQKFFSNKSWLKIHLNL